MGLHPARQGDLTQSAPVLTQDEIGTLAQTFNRMTAELRQSYAAVRESERKARAIFDSAFSLIGLLASDGTLLEANRTALEFAGVSLEAVRGKPFWDAPWWTHSPEMQRLVQAAVQTAADGLLVPAVGGFLLVLAGALTLARFGAPEKDADGHEEILGVARGNGVHAEDHQDQREDRQVAR